MPALNVQDNRSISDNGSSVADWSSINSQTTCHRRPRACQRCRARKVRCKAVNDESSDLNCCASRTRGNGKNIPLSRSSRGEKKHKPRSRRRRSPSREDNKELPPEALKGLNALLHVSTITSNERSLLSAFLPPNPNGYLELNAIMRGQLIPTDRDRGDVSNSTCRIPKNDFDIFFDVYGSSEGDRAESTPESLKSSYE